MGTADAKATFAIELDASGTTKPSDEAADALERMKQKILDGNKALAGMSQAMRNLKGGSTVNIEALKKLKEQIAAQKQSISSAQANYIKLGGSLSALVKRAGEGEGGIKGLSVAADVAGGPLGRMIRGADALKGRLAPGGVAVGALLAAAAVVALTAVVIAAAAAFLSFGVASADAARSELLHLQGLTTIRNWFGIAAGKATDLRDAINGVSASSALGRDKIAGYAEQLYKMGLRGDALNDALDATAIKASVQGEEWASLFMNMAAGARMTGQSVKALADDVRTRLGGIAKAQALGLSVQLSKLRESIRGLFQDVKIEGFLSALNEVTQLFSQNTYTGKALKTTIEGIFAPLFGDAATGGSIMKRFFQGMIIGVQEGIIAFMRLALWIKRTFSGEGFKKTLISEALDMGIVSIYVFLGALGLLAGAVAAVGGAFYLVFFKIPKIVGEFLGDAVFCFVDTFKQMGDYIDSLNWDDKAAELIMGIVNGIKKGATWVVDAVKDLASQALKAFTGAFKIKSPSKVFEDAALFIPKGAAKGIDKGRPEVAASVASMVSVPVPSGAAGSASTGGGDGTHIEKVEAHYHAAPGETPQSAAKNGESFARSFQQTLEGLVIRMGATA